MLLAIRDAALSERSRLRELHEKSSSVWSEDRVMLAAHPEVLGVPSEAIQEGRVRVAETERKIIGFSVLGFSGCESELDGLFVDPAFMRQGVGRRLLADAVQIAADAGIQTMRVVTRAELKPFYEGAGFISAGSTQTQFGPAVRLHRSLTGAST